MNDRTDYKNLPKAELHAHFNGCVPPEAIHQLIQKYGVPIPDGYSLPDDLMLLKPVSTLIDYFRPWFVFKRLPVGQDCLDQMFLTASQALVADGVRYAELRNSPFNIAEINNISLERTVEWMLESAMKASEKSGIDLRLIISLSRYKFDLARANSLLSAIAKASYRRKIVALDLSGDEDEPICGDVSALFQRAKQDLGLGVTIHAGETGNADNVRWAVEACHADRVGHGLAASTDPDMLELLRSRNVCVEVCLHSNLITGRLNSFESHPVHSFIEASVPFVLCTDNPQVHRVTLSEEYRLFVSATGRHDLIETMYDTQMAYAFDEAA